ncbi:hypothetical protein ISE1_2703 [plant metagenome]|uniref:Uncharacterized protein n=1 Tax=plant metagenome TaxID=1297885 RepID=A0A484UHF1_9ZZZZ
MPSQTNIPLIAYRCSQCHGKDVGYDASSAFNEASQTWELGTEYDSAWCNDCGDVPIEIYHPQGDELQALVVLRAEHIRKERLAENAQDLYDALTGMVEALTPHATEQNALILANAHAVLARINDDATLPAANPGA